MPEQPPDKPEIPAAPARSFGAQRGRKPLPRRTPAQSAVHQRIKVTQAKLILGQRIEGKSISEIARTFNLAPGTIYNRLAMEEVQGYLAAAQDIVATKLVPMALEVTYEKMELDRDGDMAKEVLFGAGVLSKNVRVDNTHSVKEEDFDAWRRRRIEASSEGEITNSRHGSASHVATAPPAPLPPGPLPFDDEFEL